MTIAIIILYIVLISITVMLYEKSLPERPLPPPRCDRIIRTDNYIVGEGHVRFN